MVAVAATTVVASWPAVYGRLVLSPNLAQWSGGKVFKCVGDFAKICHYTGLKQVLEVLLKFAASVV